MYCAAPVPFRSQQNLEALKRLQALELRPSRALGGWLPGIVSCEPKHEIGRGPPSGIEALSRALASAQHDFEFVAGLYLGLMAALLTAYKRIVSECREILRLHCANKLPQAADAAKSGASAA